MPISFDDQFRASFLGNDMPNVGIADMDPEGLAGGAVDPTAQTADTGGAVTNQYVTVPIVQPAGASTPPGSAAFTAGALTYSENFNSLATSGTGTGTAYAGGTLLGTTDFVFTETGGTGTTTYTANNGTSTTGDTYSYGATGSTDRAIGSLASGTVTNSYYGILFTNNTGSAISSLAISYTGEVWRVGGRTIANGADQLDFQYSLTATTIGATTGFIDYNALDFVSPVALPSTVTAGNTAPVATSSISSVLSVNIPVGATIFLRWMDSNAIGNDDGLAIDDFSVTATTAAASNGALTIANSSLNEGNSGDANMSFTVTRAGGSAGAVSATYTIANGTTDASDFGAGFVSTGTVNFAAGQTSATILVPIHGDTTFEADETFSVTLSAPTGGATLGAQTVGTGTILNDDASPQPVLSISSPTVTEGNSGTTLLTYTVSLNQSSASNVDFNYVFTDGTALHNSDYNVPINTLYGQVLTGQIAAGQTSMTFSVIVNGDTVYEANETVIATLTGATNATIGTAVGTGTIVNDDTAPTLAIGNASVVEGNSGTATLTYTVTLSAASGLTTTVNYATANGTATAGSDYVANSGTLTFAPGETSKTIAVTVNGDTVFEPNETVLVNLTAPTNATIATAQGTGTITNDDTAPPPANVFINEIHYDNAGTDTGEAIEIAGPAGTDLSGYTLVLYNGGSTAAQAAAAVTYGTPLVLSGTIDDEGSGYGAVFFSYPQDGLQNGSPDGIALVSPSGVVVQFLSYEGVMTAANGPAAGMTSIDIGVSETSGPVGQSLQLIGNGASYEDYTWRSDTASSFGSLNSGQTIIPANASGQVRVADAQVVEGNSGTTNLVFNVYRAGGLGSAATVDYQVSLNGTADGNDIGAGAMLSGTITFAVGAHSATVTIPIVGDTVGEPNETLSIALSNPTGNIAITDASGIGTIVNDDLVVLTIMQIQGAGHSSPYVGQQTQTSGIVTAVDSNGFYLQDPAGDGNAATSDGVFVFTSTAPTVAVGDAVTVNATISEFGTSPNLTTTELTAPVVTVNSHGNPLPTAILIGQGGLLPPTQVIDDDGLTSFDPTHDGIDFWESLEGMRVTLDTPQAVAQTISGETWAVVSRGVGATGINDRGGITITPNGDGTIDYNPERILLKSDSGVFAGFNPTLSVGDQLSNVTGILNYAAGNYRVTVTDAVTITSDVTLTREQTALHGDPTHLSVATYNLENLDPSDNKYDVLAGNIVYSLGAPDIIAVQEVQDADGAGTGTDLSGVSNAQGLINAISALNSALHYAYVEIAPTTTNTSGGEPNGNIRSGYLYNLDRVSYVTGSAELIPGAAYNNSRKPLVATFTFNSQNITLINLHLTSRGGSDPLEGANQPPNDAGDAARTAQAAGVKAYVNAHLADNPALNIAVLGDWNGFYFEPAQTQLTDPNQGGRLTNLNYLLPAQERYSYLFDGNAQQIDNILVTGGLLNGAQYDAVHINSQFAATDRPTDHDPQLTVLNFDRPAIAVNDTASVGAAATISNASVLGNDSDPDGQPLTVGAVNGVPGNVGQQITLASGALLTLRADGTYDYNPNHAFDTLTASTGAANSTGTDSFTYTLAGGGTAMVTITVAADPNSTAPARGTAGADTITGTGGNDMFYLQQGGSDTVSGGAGDDGFYLGATLDAGDAIDGGTGNDQLALQGTYAGLTLGAGNLVNVESLVILSGTDTRFGDVAGNTYSYDLTTVDANVAAGQQLIVQANDLRAGENLTFNGAAETDGSFLFYAGLGTDSLTGGQQSDGFFFGEGGRFSAADHVDGQSGADDQLGIRGDYAGQLTFSAATMVNIETLVLLSASDTRFGAGGTTYSYNFKLDDANVANGAQLTVSANNLGTGESATIDGSAETGGSFRFIGGAGADTFVGGAGNDLFYGRGGHDVMTGGAGSDTFYFLSSSESGTAAPDQILDFATGDRIDLATIDANGTLAGDQAFTFIGNGAFSGQAGELHVVGSGNAWMVEVDIDGDGTADMAIAVTTPGGHTWVAGDFAL